jgi:hypothetical protein
MKSNKRVSPTQWANQIGHQDMTKRRQAQFVVPDFDDDLQVNPVIPFAGSF